MSTQSAECLELYGRMLCDSSLDSWAFVSSCCSRSFCGIVSFPAKYCDLPIKCAERYGGSMEHEYKNAYLSDYL